MALFGNNNGNAGGGAAKTLAALKTAFDSNGLKYEDLGNAIPDHPALHLGFTLKNIPHADVTLIVDPDGESFKLRTGVIASVPDGRREDLVEVVNDVNYQYRWAKFFIDNDGDIIADCDVEVRPGSVGEVGFVMLMRLVGIVDEAYGTIMKTVWA